ncbi:hypothetical protein NDK43_08665 [Neobacillus pocheonensis]|uniref:Uncharacterized protein n=1 Tax=Neobacillus pocheonensis TaxID=363869 RepID=A0ABT0W8P5_9BACI|nr:hypothetical protein [Neobacillus pocheonensis]
MSNLEFLEINRNFKNYYKTLRDVNYYLTNDTELEKSQIQATSQVLSKLIYGFIRTNGTMFREMSNEQYDKEYHIFYDDFLSVIKNSGENNVEFDTFTSLIDEIIGIANHRTEALRKIKKSLPEDEIDLEDNVGENVVKNENETDNTDSDVIDLTNEVENESDGNNDVNNVVGDIIVAGEDVTVEVKSVNHVVDAVSIEVEGGRDEVEKERIAVVNVMNELEGESNKANAVDDDEVNEFQSDDLYHYRPKRKRFR